MDHDYSLIEVTEQNGQFGFDASLFVEMHWGKTGRGALAPTDSVVEQMAALARQPYQKDKEDEVRHGIGALLVTFYNKPGAPSPDSQTTTTTTTTAEEAAEHLDRERLQPPVPPERLEEVRGTVFALHSTVRGRRNRTQRAQAPVHHRFTQFVTSMQARLTRNRPVPITGQDVLRHIPELRTKAAAGILEVRTLHGQRLLDLTTFEIAPSALSPAVPHRRLDSAAHDINGGEFIPPFEGAQPVPPTPDGTEARIPPPIQRQTPASTTPPQTTAASVPGALPPPAKKKTKAGERDRR